MGNTNYNEESLSFNLMKMFLNTIIEGNTMYKKSVNKFIGECILYAIKGEDYQMDLEFYAVGHELVNEKTKDYFRKLDIENLENLRMYDYIKVRSFFNDGFTHRYIKIDNLLDE